MDTQDTQDTQDSQDPKYIGGLIANANGGVDLPDIVVAHYRAGYSIVPTNAAKKPLVEWKEFQERQPTEEELAGWVKDFTRRKFGKIETEIRGWARITGGHAGVIVLDDDTKDGEWFARFQLSPHVRTQSGGLHWIGKHPHWRVKNVNSKSGKRHTEIYPLLDIRADGGYSLIYHEHPDRYQWLRPFNEVDPLSCLDEEVQEFFGLDRAPNEKLDRFDQWENRGEHSPLGEDATDYLIGRALKEAEEIGRNNGGHWLCQQLHDHGYGAAEIEEAGFLYVERCPPTNTRGELEDYGMDAFRETMRQVLPRPRREPFLEPEVTASPVLEEGLAELKEAKGSASDPDCFDHPAARKKLDDILVPIDIGMEKEYPPPAIEGFVPVGGRAVLFGKSGSAKSYAATDLVRAAVTGTPWMDKKVRPGSVVYIAAEDAIGIHHRIGTTLREKHGGQRHHDVRVLERSLSMTNAEEVKKMLGIFDFLPEKPAYVIIDNLGLCMGDGDPNEGTAAKAFIDGCQEIQSYRWRDETKEEAEKHPITVIIVHHTNKMGTYNGSMYFQNFVDAMSEVVWDTKGSVRTIFAFKQRHGEWHKPMSFELREVDPVWKLCVVEPKQDALPRTLEGKALQKLTPQEHAILTALRDLRFEARLRGEEGIMGIIGANRGDLTIRSGVAAGSVGRFLNKLIAAGLVEKIQPPHEKGDPKPPALFQITEHGMALLNNPDLVIEAGQFKGSLEQPKVEDAEGKNPE